MLARTRQWITVAALTVAAGLYLHDAAHRCGGLWEAVRWDPATPVFYLLSIVGLACRAFWARYLVICFASAMMAIDLAGERYLGAACCAALVALLAGPGMRELFEGRAGRWNRWAAAHPRLDRLKLVFVAQSVALGLLYAFRNPLGCSGWTTLLPIAVGGLGIAALTLQKTWSVLLLLPAIAIEALYGWQLHAAASLQAAPALVLAATIASLLLLAPVLLGIWRFLRQRTPPDAPRQRMAERGDNE